MIDKQKIFCPFAIIIVLIFVIFSNTTEVIATKKITLDANITLPKGHSIRLAIITDEDAIGHEFLGKGFILRNKMCSEIIHDEYDAKKEDIIFYAPGGLSMGEDYRKEKKNILERAGFCAETTLNGKTNLYIPENVMKKQDYNTTVMEITRAIVKVNQLKEEKGKEEKEAIMEHSRIKQSWSEK